jgi:hypothetical protein
MMSNLKALPMACTLTPGDIRERLSAIQVRFFGVNRLWDD